MVKGYAKKGLQASLDGIEPRPPDVGHADAVHQVLRGNLIGHPVQPTPGASFPPQGGDAKKKAPLKFQPMMGRVACTKKTQIQMRNQKPKRVTQ